MAGEHLAAARAESALARRRHKDPRDLRWFWESKVRGTPMRALGDEAGVARITVAHAFRRLRRLGYAVREGCVLDPGGAVVVDSDGQLVG